MYEFPETNPSLIVRVKDLGDEASWAEFLAIYQPVVFRMARRRGLQETDALDVTQQVFLSIAGSVERWQQAPDKPPFRAWLTTVARNAISKAMARHPRDAATGGSSAIDLLDRIPDEAVTTSELLTETRREIVRCVAARIRSEFSDEIWQIFHLTAIEGVPIPDVARSMNRSAGSVYVARFRVIARLKERIRDMSKHWDCGGFNDDHES